MEWLANIGRLITGAGTMIWNGLKQIGGFLKENIISPVTDFLTELPGMISAGFNNVTEFVQGIFGGNVEATGRVATEATGNIGFESAQGSATQLLTLPKAPGIAPLASSGGLMPQALSGAAGAAAPLGGGVTTGLATAAAPSSFTKIMDFFGTDVGQLTAQVGAIGLAQMYQAQQTKSAYKAAAAEKRRQEAVDKENWLLQQQRESDLLGWRAQRANEEAQFGQRNQFAGFGAGWQNPTAAPPAPTLEIRG